MKVHGIECMVELVDSQSEGIYDFQRVMKSISENGNFGLILILGKYYLLPINGNYRKITESDVNRLRGSFLLSPPLTLKPEMLYRDYISDEDLQGVVDRLIEFNQMCLRTNRGSNLSLWVCYTNDYLNLKKE